VSRSQNFDDISDRLAMMHGELSSLTAMFKRTDIAERLKLNIEKDLRGMDNVESSAETPPIAGPGHVVRDDQTLVERYHGPCTLVALSRNFGADLISHLGRNDETVGNLISKMLLDISSNDSMDFEMAMGHDDTVCLPPRQFLSVMLDTFLKQADYSTDIFSSQNLHEAVERVYREPPGPASESWALCFNLIILLALGSEHPVRGDDPFVRPMLHAAHVAARKPSFFMSPRLVNVQALALLSLLAQQYHEETFGDSIFAQACMLAKAIGLHQTSYGASSDLSPKEAEERQKVFRSLYIRDRLSITAHGAQPWLSDKPSQSLVDRQGSPAWELTKVQDELERLCGADAVDMTVSERQLGFVRVQEKLKIWSKTHYIPSPSRPSATEVLHYLAFLGTRMRALDSQSVSNTAQALYDARLSCLLVATSSNALLNEALADELDHLLSNPVSTSSAAYRPQSSPSSSPYSRSIAAAASSIRNATQRSGLLTPPNQTSVQTHLPIHRLANVFPTKALFIIARNILGVQASNTQQPQARTPGVSNIDNDAFQHERNEDIALLETVLFCFRSAAIPPPTSTCAAKSPATYTFKLARVLQHLIAIIHATIDPMSANTSSTFLTDSHLLDVLGASTDALSLPNLHLYTNGSDSGSNISPPFYPGLSLSNTTAGSSSDTSLAMTPISGPPIPDTPFDISQFLNQMGSMGSPGMWQAGDMSMPQQPQYMAEQPAGAKRIWGKNKRARTDSLSDDQDQDIDFRID
jgi:hypothetical protein